MTFLTLLQNYGGPVIVTGAGSLAGAGALSGTGTTITPTTGSTVDHVRPPRRATVVQKRAKGIRRPGVLPNLPTHILEAQAALEQLPVSLRGPMRAVLEPLIDLALEQYDFDRRQRDRYNSLPAPHGQTHLGGGDNIVCLDDPSPLTPFSTGDPGDPHECVSAGGHVHDMSAFLAYLDNADTEVRNGFTLLMTSAPRLESLLQRILLAIAELKALVGPGNARNH